MATRAKVQAPKEAPAAPSASEEAVTPVSARPKRTRGEPKEWFKSGGGAHENGTEGGGGDDKEDDDDVPTPATEPKRPRRSAAAANTAVAAVIAADHTPDEEGKDGANLESRFTAAGARGAVEKKKLSLIHI